MAGVLESRVLRFGPFELDRETGELRKHGIRVRLQGKPLQVLLALLERPGQVVTRDELKRRLWTEDTFVDFESGLNTAANRLRITLGDSADQPRYVETLARAGYRFIAPVGFLEVESVPVPAAAPPPPRRDLRWIVAILGALAIALLVIIFWPKAAAQPSFQQITFRRGTIWSARFAPDAQTILYSARWEVDPWRLFLSSRVSPETRVLGYDKALLTAVSRTGELSMLGSYGAADNFGTGLFRVPLNGGSPLTVTHGVSCADWSADGHDLAVVRPAGAESSIEFPVGNVIYRTPSLLGGARVSRDGSQIAFIEHPVRGDDAGAIRMVDRHGTSKTLSEGWASLNGLAWSAAGNEVWFTAARTGSVRSLWAVTTSGRLRAVARIPGSMRLHDISRDGAVLVSNESARLEMAGRTAGDQNERDLSWFDWSAAEEFSRDGTRLLFDESGEGGGPGWSVYLRDLRNGSTVRLGDGRALTLDPEARWAVTLPTAPHSPLSVVEMADGATHRLPRHNLDYHWARAFPDGTNLLVAANPPGHGVRLYIYPLDGSPPHPIEPEIFLRNPTISRDGRTIAGADPGGKVFLVSADGGEPQPVACPFAAVPIAWGPDDKSLLVEQLSELPVRIYRIDLKSGKSTLWREIAPAYRAGVESIIRLQIAPDEKTYAYSFTRMFSQLYVASGWR